MLSRKGGRRERFVLYAEFRSLAVSGAGKWDERAPDRFIGVVETTTVKMDVKIL